MGERSWCQCEVSARRWPIAPVSVSSVRKTESTNRQLPPTEKRYSHYVPMRAGQGFCHKGSFAAVAAIALPAFWLVDGLAKVAVEPGKVGHMWATTRPK